MSQHNVTLSDLVLIAGTRVALGVGIGLLLSDRLSKEQRMAAGLTLAVFGGVTTIPLALRVLGKRRSTPTEFGSAA
jgi:hypothetical protein